MPRAKKLPSGNWRVQVYQKLPDGSAARKSFTATTKKEAEFLAAQFALDKKEQKAGKDKTTMLTALERYIRTKENVLSPATVREYKRCLNTFQEVGIADIRVDSITSDDIQRAVNLFAKNHAPKSVRNLHGLISAVIKTYRPDFCLSTTLPQKIKTELYVPSEEDIKRLLEEVRGKKIGIAVMLAAFGSLRRSEIAALTIQDISGNTISVNKAMVFGPEHEWVIKTTKTYSSTRLVTMPDFVIAAIRASEPSEDGRICGISPNVITRYFEEALAKTNLPHFRFHDLRHYQASILHAMGVPDKYICERGGWTTDSTLKRIYQHTMSDKRQEVEKQICSYFELHNKQSTETENFEKLHTKLHTTADKRGKNAV